MAKAKDNALWWILGGTLGAAFLFGVLSARREAQRRQKLVPRPREGASPWLTELPESRAPDIQSAIKRSPWAFIEEAREKAADVVEDVREAAVNVIKQYDVGKVFAYVKGHESSGDPGAINANTDGEGLSYGLLQWTQSSGNLGKLLQKMVNADGVAFRDIFGPDWSSMLSVAKSARLEPVSGAQLWEEPWKARFREAGTYEPFIEVQRREMATGEHWRAAERIATTLKVKSERAMALFFDRADHQGPSGAPNVALKLAERYDRDGWPDYRTLLSDYAQACVDVFRSATDPGGSRWKKVGNEWHKFSRNGKQDLVPMIEKRVNHILSSTTLSDDLV